MKREPQALREPVGNRAVRQSVGWSAAKVAAYCDVGPTLVRIFEIDPDEVSDPTKKAKLARFYDALRVCSTGSAA